MFHTLSQAPATFAFGLLTFDPLTPATPVDPNLATNAVAGVGLGGGFADTCSYANYFAYRVWKVSITNDNKYNTAGCGLGFLDSFRAICGDITIWTCDYEVKTDNVNLSFSPAVAYDGGDTTGAIRVAYYQALDITRPRIL